jgi:hypothetical protein
VTKGLSPDHLVVVVFGPGGDSKVDPLSCLTSSKKRALLFERIIIHTWRYLKSGSAVGGYTHGSHQRNEKYNGCIGKA